MIGDKQRQRRKSQPRPVDNSRPAQRGERRRSEGPIDDQNVAIERKIRSSPAKVKSNDRTPPQRSTQ